MNDNPILRKVSEYLIPPIVVYALYVQFHGDFGPGGGFQAGVIFASAFILYALIYGLDKTLRLVPPRVIRVLVALGLFIYAMIGILGVLLGGNFLDYNVLAADALSGQHWGILLIEAGVGITVGAVMIAVFYGFAGRGR